MMTFEALEFLTHQEHLQAQHIIMMYLMLHFDITEVKCLQCVDDTLYFIDSLTKTLSQCFILLTVILYEQ